MSMSQHTILIVEDEPLLRIILSEALQDEGYRVLAAASVLEAIGQIAKHADIDGLITDVDLPGGLSGLDLLELFSNCRPAAATIVVSGRGDLREADLAVPSRVFAKPYDLDHVIGELERQITDKNAERTMRRTAS